MRIIVSILIFLVTILLLGVEVDPTSAQTAEPYITSTPRADGAIFHITGQGQSLIGIAEEYQVSLEEILRLNDLNLDSIIYPGEKILIRPGNTATATLRPTATQPSATPTASATLPTPTPRNTFTPKPSVTTTKTPRPTPITVEHGQLATGVVILAFVIFLVVIISGFLSSGRVGTKRE